MKISKKNIDLMSEVLKSSTSVEVWNELRLDFIGQYGVEVVNTYVDAALLIRHATFMPLGENEPNEPRETLMARRIRKSMLSQYQTNEYIELYLTPDENGNYAFPQWLVHELLRLEVTNS